MGCKRDVQVAHCMQMLCHRTVSCADESLKVRKSQLYRGRGSRGVETNFLSRGAMQSIGSNDASIFDRDHVSCIAYKSPSQRCGHGRAMQESIPFINYQRQDGMENYDYLRGISFFPLPQREHVFLIEIQCDISSWIKCVFFCFPINKHVAKSQSQPGARSELSQLFITLLVSCIKTHHICANRTAVVPRFPRDAVRLQFGWTVSPSLWLKSHRTAALLCPTPHYYLEFRYSHRESKDIFNRHIVGGQSIRLGIIVGPGLSKSEERENRRSRTKRVKGSVGGSVASRSQTCQEFGELFHI